MWSQISGAKPPNADITGTRYRPKPGILDLLGTFSEGRRVDFLGTEGQSLIFWVRKAPWSPRNTINRPAGVLISQVREASRPTYPQILGVSLWKTLKATDITGAPC